MIFKRKDAVSKIVLLDNSTEVYHSVLNHYKYFHYLTVVDNAICGGLVLKFHSSLTLFVDTFNFHDN